MFTAEDRMTMDAMNAKRKKKEEDERDAKIERRVTKNFERKYGKGSSNKASQERDRASDSEESESTDDYSTDDGARTRTHNDRKLRKMKKEQSQMRKEIKELKKYKEEYEAVDRSVTGHLVSPHKPGSKDAADADEPKLTMAQWLQHKQGAYIQVHTQKPRGLFDAECTRESEASGSSTVSIVQRLCHTLDEKLDIANTAKDLSLGVNVSTTTENHLKPICNQVAEKYFSGAQKAEATSALEELKTKYSIDTRAKVPNTLLAAIVRACVSRGINLTDEELGLGKYALS